LVLFSLVPFPPNEILKPPVVEFVKLIFVPFPEKLPKVLLPPKVPLVKLNLVPLPEKFPVVILPNPPEV